jgi:hypothetical protein
VEPVTGPTSACQPVTVCAYDRPGWAAHCLSNPGGGPPVDCADFYNPQLCPVPEGY